MKRTRKFLFISVPTFIGMILLLEITFRFFIPASQTPDTYFDEENLILKLDTLPKTGVFTMGRLGQERSNWQINNHGWNSRQDYRFQKASDSKRICIIGDSFIEGKHVDVDKHLGVILSQKLDGVEVFSFGRSGAPLSQYLHMARFVVSNYQPDVLIFQLVHNDFDESIRRFKFLPYFMQLEINDGGVMELPPSKHRSRNWLKRSALLRYLLFNLELSKPINRLSNRERKYVANVDMKLLDARRAEITKITDYVFGQISDLSEFMKTILIMDADRQNIYNHAGDHEHAWMHHLVDDLSTKHGLAFLDLSDFFRKDYMMNAIAFNSTLDNHWNAYGHLKAAEALSLFLQGK